MSRKKPRHLSPDELELWNRVAKTATPLTSDKPLPQVIAPVKAPKAKPSVAVDPLPKFRVGERADTALPTPYARTQKPALRMDARAFNRLRKGKGRPEARIDLHGLTAAEAEQRLTTFLFSAHARGARLVLVITGKGRDKDEPGPIPTRSGVLRRELPLWLSRPPLSAIVLQTTPAHRKHGGSGAFYVYLAKRR